MFKPGLSSFGFGKKSIGFLGSKFVLSLDVNGLQSCIRFIVVCFRVFNYCIVHVVNVFSEEE